MSHKLILPCVCLSLFSCNDKQSSGYTPVDSNSTENTNIKLPKQTLTALRYLDGDADYLMINSLESEANFVESQYSDVDRLISKIARNERLDLPTSLKLKPVTERLEINTFKGVSGSSKKLSDAWLNKFFLDNGGKQDGVYGLYSIPSENWGFEDFAPAGADIVVEQSQNVTAAAELIKYAASLGGEEYQKLLNKILAHTPKHSDQTIAELVENKVLTTSMAITIDESHTCDVTGGGKLANLECIIRVDGGSALWNFFADEIEKDSTIVEKDGLKFVKSPKSYPTFKGLPDVDPMFVIDKQKDQLWFVLRSDYFEQCRSEKMKFAQGEDFKKLSEHIPTSGFSFSYMSQDAFQLMKQYYTVKQMRTSSKFYTGGYVSKDEKVMVDVSIELLSKDIFPRLIKSKLGHATAIQLTKDGLLYTSYDAYPVKGLPVAGVSTGFAPFFTMYATAEPK